jgi:OmpA-OmpF porin, OOP family
MQSRMLFTLFVVLFLSSSANAQEAVRSQLFGDTDKLFAQAKENSAVLYAPRTYEKALEAYHDAEEAFKRGKDLSDVQSLLKESSSLLNKALEVSKLGEVTFPKVMAARKAAKTAEADGSAAELWTKAEAQFKRAATDLEDGDVKSARDEASEAEATYRTAELEAIKTSYLAPARELLAKADDSKVKKLAPKTLEHARTLTAQVEDLLKQNRYDTDEARQMAVEAKQEAQHAIALNEYLQTWEGGDKTLEDLVNSFEGRLQDVARALEMPLHFSEGYDPAVQSLVTAITNRAAKAASDSALLKEKNGEIGSLKQQVASMESRLGTLTESERELKTRIEGQRKAEELFAQVAAMFTLQEGTVLRDGNNVIIRLTGLNFPTSRNAIEPQYFGTLTKVQDAIRKYGSCRVAIEGHTDSRGSDDSNLKTSEGRAQAVAEYLKANMGTGVPIASRGMGESRPIASNDSPEGRAKNKRIDVVISPAEK